MAEIKLKKDVPKRGFFIVFEGIDGAGTTTQSKLLFDNLKAKGFDCILTSEPWKSESGKLAREVIGKKKKLGGSALQLLFCSDRAEHVEEEILPAINEDKIVICDRYYYSTFVFGEMMGLDKKWLEKINGSFPKPDIAFLLTCDPETALSRIEKRGKALEQFEKKDFLKKADSLYKKLANSYLEIIRIDSEENIEKCSDKIYEKIIKRI